MDRRPSDPPGGFGSDKRHIKEQQLADPWAREPAHGPFPLDKTRLGVTIRLFNGRVSIVDARGEPLGSWPAVNVAAESLGRRQYDLVVDRKHIVFTADDDEGLLANLQVEAKRFLEGVGRSELTRPAKIYSGHVAGRQEAPSPPPDSSDPAPDAPFADSGSTASADGRLMSDVYAVEAQQGESHHSKFASTQREVIRWMSEAMFSWFGFHMRMYEGTNRNNHQVTDGLVMAAKQLRSIADDLEYFAESGSPRDGLLLLVYRDAVVSWAAALESLSRAPLTDHHHTARGFRLLDSGTATAKRVIDFGSRRGRSDTLKKSLRSLRKLRPHDNVPRATLKREKEPWKNALIAAGSPLLWTA